MNYVPCIFSLLLCGYNALKISFHFFARKKAFFRNNFSFISSDNSNRETGILHNKSTATAKGTWRCITALPRK